MSFHLSDYFPAFISNLFPANFLAANNKPPSDDPQPIPEEEENVEPIPGLQCEPTSFSKTDLAKRILPLLPSEVRDVYIKRAQQKNTDALSELAWDLAATHEKGGLNSSNQRVTYYSSRLGKNVEATDWNAITRSEAYRFIAGWREYRFGKFAVPHTQLSTALATFIPPGMDRPIVESLFFPNAPLDGGGRRGKPVSSYLPATLTGISDGDTVKVIVTRDGCASEQGSIRFAGIDTPEKFVSREKMLPQLSAMLNDLKDRGLIKDQENRQDSAVGALLLNRMVYDGEVSSLIMKDFLPWAIKQGGKFFVEETYNRVLKNGDEAAACDEVTLYDVYLRMIWVLRIEPPSLITEYIEKKLYELMNGEAAKFSFKVGDEEGSYSNGRDLWNRKQLDYLTKHGKQQERDKYLAAQTALQKLRSSGRTQLADFIDPAKIVPTNRLYDRENITLILKTWKDFVAKHPDRAGDINAMMVAVGAAYAYTKYRNNLSSEYLELGNEVKDLNLALWQEETTKILDPNVRVVNKEKGVFEPFEPPKDCTER